MRSPPARLRSERSQVVLPQVFGAREGVSADIISSQLSPWASALFEFLPPFIRREIEIEKLLAFLVEVEMNKRLHSVRSQDVLVFSVPVAEGSYEPLKNIRMANLSVVCCHTVNGVSREQHLETLKKRVFKVIFLFFDCHTTLTKNFNLIL
nr:pyrophosphate--fructose 6-phosphate 1-phosphotransferase subunit alpha [Ipomoea batatas]